MQLSRELNSSFKNFLETIDHKILYTPKIIPAAHTRLICFSYAGGNSATFLPWLKFLPLDIELVVVQLPGRGCRLFEQPIETMSEVVSLIAGMVASRADKELVFFGHSLGAKVAYEVIRHLDKANFVLPRMFFASGSSSPFARRDLDCIHTLPDAEFISKLRELNGTPEAVLENPEIMELVMPALRADFKIVENYQNHEDSILPVELSHTPSLSLFVFPPIFTICMGKCKPAKGNSFYWNIYCAFIIYISFYFNQFTGARC